MDDLSNDHSWVYIAVIVIVTGVAVYLMPKVIVFLDKFVEEKHAHRERQKSSAKNADENRNRYKTF